MERRERGDGMKKLKPCPYRVHGERVPSLTVPEAFYYNEVFMPCMGKKCSCYEEDACDAYCRRDNTYLRMTKEEDHVDGDM